MYKYSSKWTLTTDWTMYRRCIGLKKKKYRSDCLIMKIIPAIPSENINCRSKKAITGKWLQADPPTLDNWLEIIKGIHEMERLTFLLRLTYDLSIARWTKLSIFA